MRSLTLVRGLGRSIYVIRMGITKLCKLKWAK